MNRALWKKAWGEVRLTLPLLVVMMLGFQALFVWITSRLDLEKIAIFLRGLEEPVRRLLSVSIEAMTTYSGRVAIGYDHPVIAIGCAYWAVARGSDAVSGPLNRGTLELMLAQPVRRISVLGVNASVTLGGAAALAIASWLGDYIGLTIVPKMHDVAAGPYAYCALNLFAYTCCLAGVTTLISACGRYRARTIGLAIGFYVVSVVLKVIGRVSDHYQAFLYGSFLSIYEPQRFVDSQYDPLRLSLQYDIPLLLIALVCYLLAAVIFTRRDIPAPL
jgi:ABC-2 type transport system permease protein